VAQERTTREENFKMIRTDKRKSELTNSNSQKVVNESPKSISPDINQRVILSNEETNSSNEIYSNSDLAIIFNQYITKQEGISNAKTANNESLKNSLEEEVFQLKKDYCATYESLDSSLVNAEETKIYTQFSNDLY
jgi:hypothetical protein